MARTEGDPDEECDFYLFPIRNEQGFRVDSADAYGHMIASLVNASVELSADYPAHKILVVYEV